MHRVFLQPEVIQINSLSMGEAMSISCRHFLFVLLCGTILLTITVPFYHLEWFNWRNRYEERSAPSWRQMDDMYGNNCLKMGESFSGEELFRTFDGVKTFLMFIGYPRTGHSLIASLLDAHPQIIVPHEYNIMMNFNLRPAANSSRETLETLKNTLFFELMTRSRRQALFEIRAPKLSYRGTYGYHVPGAWQGMFTDSIQVIGDKKADWTASQGPAEVFSYIDELEKVVGIPVKWIHVVRNPFDIIATNALRLLNERDNVRDSEKKINNSTLLDQQIEKFFSRAFTCKETIKRFGDNVLTLKSHEMIERPRETLQKLCEHLMVTCYPEYVEACVKIVSSTPSVTRNFLVWTNEQKERVLERMKDYSFLRDYSFEDTL